MLNGTSRVIGSWDHSLGWVVNEWAPLAANAGLKYFAMVATPQTFAESTAFSFYSKLKAFEARVFDKPEEAKRWFRRLAVQITGR